MENKLKLFCDSTKCCWCGICKSSCPADAIVFKRDSFRNNVFIDQTKCLNCGTCNRVCQAQHKPVFNEPLFWKEGWSKYEILRLNSSSGGLAKAIAINASKENFKVFMCVAEKDSFSYKEVVDKTEILSVKGSYYAKSSLNDVQKHILTYLKSNQKVLFIGLPCHVASIKRFVGENNDRNLYTIDIICHGTPSIELFKTFAKEENISDFYEISFRQKNRSSFKPLKFDYWCIPFLDGTTYTENCYHCIYATHKRISDITLGDSWGTSRDDSEQNKGISLVLINTNKGNEIIPKESTFLSDVDQNSSIEKQGQLKTHAQRPINYDEIISVFSKTNNYHKTIRLFYKKRIRIARLRNNRLIYFIYRKIKPPKYPVFTSFSVKNN